MPHFSIRTINSAFEAKDEGEEYPDLDAAYRAAVEAGIAMASDEIQEGGSVGIIAIHVEDAAGRLLARGVVSVATARLMLG